MKEHIPHPRIREHQDEGPRLTRNENKGLSGKLALFLTHKFGSMGMFYGLLVWMGGWMILATIGWSYFKNDPYPFTFLLFLSNLIQLLALPVLAVGQQVLGRASDKQAEQTYRDTEAILKLQDEIHRLIKINNELTEQIHKIITTTTVAGNQN